MMYLLHELFLIIIYEVCIATYNIMYMYMHKVKVTVALLIFFEFNCLTKS